MRGYHGDFINEKIFKRWYLPETLPDVRPPSSATASSAVADAMWATKDTVAQRWQKQLEDERRKGLAPVGSLMMAEIERRIDVVIFRACLRIACTRWTATEAFCPTAIKYVLLRWRVQSDHVTPSSRSIAAGKDE